MIFWHSKLFFSILIISSIILIDQALKFLFASTCNSGIAFGLLQAAGFFNVAISFFVIVAAFYFLRSERRVIVSFSLSLVIGGGVSNLIDRVAIGCVRDFVDLKFWPSLTWLSPSLTRWPSFNVADSAITVGTATLVLAMIFKRSKSNDLNH